MATLKKIAIYGAGGFGKEVATLINKINENNPTWNMVGFIDDGQEKGTQISHFGKVLGDFTYLNQVKESLCVAFAIGNSKTLFLLVAKIKNPLISFPNIIHPEVYFADPKSFKIGYCNVIVR